MMKKTNQQQSSKLSEFMRPPSVLMKLDRLGSFHQTRLSFMRTLLRRLKSENWKFDRPVWEIDKNGEGHAVYCARGPRHTYSLVAFAHDLPADQRSDRVIATAWDNTFSLFDGEPTQEDIARLKLNVPFQEAGRISDKELSLSRANRSMRLWKHVVDKLASGKQPDVEQIKSVGYLLRTTAVYGSGKFGAADRALIDKREFVKGPFRIEMLSVFLTRAFSLDLVEHIAKAKGGNTAVTIESSLRRRFGIGNSTGLGMAPFLVNHPALLHQWISAREKALARVRSLESATTIEQQQFLQFLQRATLNVENWHTAHPIQLKKNEQLRSDLKLLTNHLAENSLLTKQLPWDSLCKWAEKNLSVEGQEQLASLTIEPYGHLVDDLTDNMGADEYSEFRIDGNQSVETLKKLLEVNYSWALSLDFDQKYSNSKFWYVSEEKLEPRLGERYDEPGEEFEQPLCTAKDATSLYQSLSDWSQKSELASFLLAHPEHRHMVRRVQTHAKYPYAEIQDNLISADFLAIDMLRCKLSFFGAIHFDPRSDRWVRICLYQNAPFPEELSNSPADDWAYPPLTSAMETLPNE